MREPYLFPRATVRTKEGEYLEQRGLLGMYCIVIMLESKGFEMLRKSMPKKFSLAI